MSENGFTGGKGDLAYTVFDQILTYSLANMHCDVTRSIIETDCGDEQEEMKHLIAQLKLSCSARSMSLPKSPECDFYGSNGSCDMSSTTMYATLRTSSSSSSSTRLHNIQREYSSISNPSYIPDNNDIRGIGLCETPSLTSGSYISDKEYLIPSHMLQRPNSNLGPQYASNPLEDTPCPPDVQHLPNCNRSNQGAMDEKKDLVPRRRSDPATSIGKRRATFAEFGNIDTEGLQSSINSMRASLSEPISDISSFTTLNNDNCQTASPWGHEQKSFTSVVSSLDISSPFVVQKAIATRSLDTLDLIIAKYESAQTKVEAVGMNFERCTSSDCGSEHTAALKSPTRQEIQPPLNVTMSHIPVISTISDNRDCAAAGNWIELSTLSANHLPSSHQARATAQPQRYREHPISRLNDLSRREAVDARLIQTDTPVYNFQGLVPTGGNWGCNKPRKPKVKVSKPTTTRDRTTRCVHCGTNTTVTWRRLKGELVCNACGLYFKSKGLMRPLDIRQGPKNRIVRKKSAKKAQ